MAGDGPAADPLATALDNLAGTMHDYYAALVRVDFSAEDALRLTVGFQDTILRYRLDKLESHKASP